MNSNKLVTADITDSTPVRPAYSIVAPVFNEEETLPHFYQRVIKVMEEVGESFELVLINDGSRDGSFRTMRDLHDRDPRVRVIDFSRNVGHQIAISAWVGFRQEAVLYERHERFAGTTKYPMLKMVRFSLDAITSFSHLPLELATSFGFVLAAISLVGIVIAALLRIFTGAIVGQASTLILVLFLGGIQLIFLGIIGEYLGRIYDEVRARPLYIAREVLDK